MKLLKEIRQKRGQVSESRVREALSSLDSDHEQSFDWTDLKFDGYAIVDWWSTNKFDHNDVKGIDLNLLVYTHQMGQRNILVQVKSSKAAAKRHLAEYPDIPVVVVSPLKTQEDLMKDLDLIIRTIMECDVCH